MFVRMEHAGSFNLPADAKLVHSRLVDDLRNHSYILLAFKCPTGHIDQIWAHFIDKDETHLMCKVEFRPLLSSMHGITTDTVLVVEHQYLIAALL